MSKLISVGILGSGRMGRALGRLWSRVGHRVGYAYARDLARLEALAKEDGGEAWAGSVEKVTQGSEVLLVAVPWHRVDDLLAQAGDLAGKVVVSCSLPMTPDDTALAVGHTTSGAEELARRRPGARVVSGFNTLPSELLAALADVPPAIPPQVVLCGDDADAKTTVADLARSAGLEPVDAGSLAVARYIEPFGLLVGQLAYAEGADPRLSYRFATLGAQP